MVREIMHDEAFLAQKAEFATPEDLPVARDLLDTLTAHKDGCVGMAANMIGINKRIVILSDTHGLLRPEAVEAFAGQLTEYKTSKGVIQLPYHKPLPLELITEIAKWCEANAEA